MMAQVWLWPLSCRQFSEPAYREFKQHTLEEAAMAAARAGSVTEVKLLCGSHPQRLIPGMLALLACLPETALHEAYSQLLELVSSSLSVQSCFLVFCILHIIELLCLLLM